MSVEEYTIDFVNLMLKSELEEPEEHSLARYLGGLNFEITSVINLQTCCSLNDVMKLELKVERKIKTRSIMGRHGAKKGYSRASKFKGFICSKKHS